MSSREVQKWSVPMNGTAREEQPPGGEGPALQLLPSLGDDFGKNRVSVLFYFSSTKTAQRLSPKHLNIVLCGWMVFSLWPSRPPTWELLVSLHPPDGGGRLTAHGRARHLRLVALPQDLVPGLDDGVTWRNWHGTESSLAAPRKQRTSS